ncbi:DUF561 domain-containing protein [Tanacetum coccineum]
MVIYEGNESCKVYIISFLAAIPIRELVADMKRGSCLQIEFHCTQLHPPPPTAANPDHRPGRDHAPVPTPVPVPDNAISAPPVGKSAIQILNLTMETRRRLPLVTLCVTVPHTLSLSDQAKLAKHLEQEGADIIQTQGGKCSNPSNPGLSVATAPMAITTGVAGVEEKETVASAFGED